MSKKKITADKWVWMPHAAHFILGDKCQFHLATRVGDYIISTVGELWHDAPVREIIAESKGIKLAGVGDDRARNYMAKIGFDEIGCGRKYETMVFKRGVKQKNSCCPYRPSGGGELDFKGYNDPEEAYKGHMKMCKKWS